MRSARLWLLVHTLDASPYLVPFAQRSASSSSVNGWTVITGPKISVLDISSPCWMPSITVGA
jgi:hypothetical protein